jgi:hypothetical protein
LVRGVNMVERAIGYQIYGTEATRMSMMAWV